MKTLTTFFSVIIISVITINNSSAVVLPPYSGYSVSVSGNFLMWGQEQLIEEKPGKAYIKHCVTFQEWLLTANDGRNCDRFGHSISIDGNWAIIGADGDDTVGPEAGAAYMFNFDGINWSQRQKLVGLDTRRDDGFGCSVYISGNFAIAGAYYANNGTGAAYIFYYNGTNWVQQAKITADDASFGDFFGWSVSISGNYAIVGAPLDRVELASGAGSAYIFYYNGTNWVQQAKIIAGDPQDYDQFGYSVSINDYYAFVGSYLDDDFGTDSGSTYVFRRNGTIWEQIQKLTAYDANTGDWFGYSVCVSGDYALVGSPLDNYKGIDSGSVFFYKNDGTKWALRGKLTGTSADLESRFGLYVCTDSNKIIMGGKGSASWLLSMPSIEPVQNTPQAGSMFNLRVNVNVPFDVEPVTLYYRQGGKSDFNSIPFTLESGTYKNGTWIAIIPADQVTMRGIEYYIVAPERDRDRNIYFYGTMYEPYFLPVHGNISIDLKTTIAKKPNTWNIIAPSVITDYKNIVQNLSSLGVFGLNWMAWRWNTSANRWEVPQNYRSFPVSSDQFDTSIGWWVMVFGDGSNRSVNVSGTSVDCQNPYSITLKTGWNNIANPFDFPVAWADNTIRIEYNNQQVTPTQSKENLWVDNRTFWYNNATNQYSISVSNQNPPYPMPPKVGFWIYSMVNNANLIIYPIESISASPPSYFVNSNEEKTIWKVLFSLETDEGNDSVEVVISDIDCSKINHIKPPSMPFVKTRIGIIDPDDNVELSKSIGLIRDQTSWLIKVDVPHSGHLIWKMEGVSRNYDLIFEDISTGKFYDLKKDNGIYIDGQDEPRYFVLMVSRQDIPLKTKILPNYPNPFNPDTWIPFELSKPANVIVKIFSSDGRLIRTLDLGNKPAGRYITKDRSAYWDGKNELGEYVSSGVYFYVMKIGDIESVHKMIIIK